MSPALEIDRLTIERSARPVLQAVNAQLEAGSFTALLGPNGAGKSTLLLAALGLLKPQAGDVRLFGDPVSRLTPAARARRAAYLPQHRSVAWAMSVRDVTALGRFAHGGASYIQLDAAGRAAVDRALERAGASALAERRIETLSGGEQARVHLARALAAEAPILLVDEPVAALDPRHQLEVMALLKAEAAAGRLVIAALHDLPAAARWCDRVLILDDGRLVADGTPEAVLTDALLADVFGVCAGSARRLAALDLLSNAHP